jgi:hypothetical protein
MAEKNYAFIKDGDVVNIAVFDDPTPELLNHFKEAHQVDDIIVANDRSAIGGTYDGAKFWLPKPFPSWVKNQETNDWEAPVAKPEFDPENPKFYSWDEESLSWLELVPAE